MRRLILPTVIATTLAAGSAWALFETNKDLIASAKIPLEEAVKSAIKVVPGKAAEADLGKDDGRTNAHPLQRSVQSTVNQQTAEAQTHQLYCLAVSSGVV